MADMSEAGDVDEDKPRSLPSGKNTPGSDTAGKKFGQREPPLSVTIRGILERYPDGQIFKVSLVDLLKYGYYGLTP